MEFSGERYLPEMNIDSEISIFHRQRYESILSICAGKNVVDAACGEGYGSSFIAEKAACVIGIDISHEAIENAKGKYQKENLHYYEASVERIPVEDNWADVFVSYETIEHVTEDIQRKFLKEIRRILKKDGILIMSSPDKRNYSDIPQFHNEFHVHELYFEEFDALLKRYFPNRKYYYQGMFCNSYIFGKEQGISGREKKLILRESDQTRSEYLIAVCGKRKGEADISSVIYDASNMYYLLKDEVLQLKERLGEPGKIIEQKENYIGEQREKILEMEKELREANGVIEQKENYIGEQREKILEVEKELQEVNGVIEQKENYIGEQREKILEVEKELQEANGVIEQKENYIGEQREKILEVEKELREANGVIEQKENYIGEQREKILEVEKELQEANGVIEQKENYIGEQREKILEVEKELREANGVIEQKENYIGEQREKILEVEKELSEANGVIGEKENYIEEQREKISQIEKQLQKEMELEEKQEKEYKQKELDFSSLVKGLETELEETKKSFHNSMVQQEKLKREKKHFVNAVIFLGLALFIFIIIFFVRGNNADNSSVSAREGLELTKIDENESSSGMFIINTTTVDHFDVMSDWAEIGMNSTEVLKGSYDIETLSDGSKFAWVEANSSIELKNIPDTTQIEIKGFMPLDIHQKAGINMVELKVLVDGKEVQSFSYEKDCEVIILLEKQEVLSDKEEEYITIEFQATSYVNQFEQGIANDNRNLSWRVNSIYLK